MLLLFYGGKTTEVLKKWHCYAVFFHGDGARGFLP